MHRPPAPQTSALTGLRYTPTGQKPKVSLGFLTARRQPPGERKDDKIRQKTPFSDKSGGKTGGKPAGRSGPVPCPTPRPASEAAP
jgi:hypothetical protein